MSSIADKAIAEIEANRNDIDEIQFGDVKLIIRHGKIQYVRVERQILSSDRE